MTTEEWTEDKALGRTLVPPLPNFRPHLQDLTDRVRGYVEAARSLTLLPQLPFIRKTQGTAMVASVIEMRN